MGDNAALSSLISLPFALPPDHQTFWQILHRKVYRKTLLSSSWLPRCENAGPMHSLELLFIFHNTIYLK